MPVEVQPIQHRQRASGMRPRSRVTGKYSSADDIRSGLGLTDRSVGHGLHSRDSKDDRFRRWCLAVGASFEEGHSGCDLAEGVAELVCIAYVGFGGQAERREP